MKTWNDPCYVIFVPGMVTPGKAFMGQYMEEWDCSRHKMPKLKFESWCLRYVYISAYDYRATTDISHPMPILNILFCTIKLSLFSVRLGKLLKSISTGLQLKNVMAANNNSKNKTHSSFCSVSIPYQLIALYVTNPLSWIKNLKRFS